MVFTVILEVFRKTYSPFSKVVEVPGFNRTEKFMSYFSEMIRFRGIETEVYRKLLYPRLERVTFHSCPLPYTHTHNLWPKIRGTLGGSL